MAEFELITTKQALIACMERLAPEKVVALDTEASSFHRFKERVCLVQLSTRGQTFLIDPMAVPDLAPLGKLLADPGMEIVIHDADYDLRMLAKHHGIRVENVFDTLVAAELVNEPEISLAALLGKYQGLVIDKKFQKADWSKRPLPAPMLDYAAGDTSHLIALRDILEEKLQQKKRLSWAQEEFALLPNMPFSQAANEEPGFLRMKGAKSLKPDQLAVLRELHVWRDQIAEQQDRAAFMVLGNDVLLALAKEPPNGIEEVGALKGVNERIIERYGKQVMMAIKRGQDLPKEQWPRTERPKRWNRDNDYEERFKRLKQVREELTSAHDLRPGIVAANQLLADIARTLPGDIAALGALPGMRKYQVENFGAALLKVL